MHYTPLPERSLIQLSGEDAASFLQGLVSNDVSRLQNGVALYAALLTPQGKFLHDFFLIPWRDAILIDVAAAGAADVLARLTMYKLRSKLALAPAGHLAVMTAWGEDAPAAHNDAYRMFADPRASQMGFRLVGEAAALASYAAAQSWQAVSPDAYHRLRLACAVPDTQDMIRDKSLLLEFGFEDLHGVDFTKGCYVGQEVTARSKFRGQVRKFIYQVRAGTGVLPAIGTPVTYHGETVGEMRSSLGGLGLALLRVAVVEQAQAEKQSFYAGQTAFTAAAPNWVAHPPKALIIHE